MSDTSRRAVALGAAAILMALPAQVDAQMGDIGPESRIVVEARGGIALPLSDLGDIQDPGYAAGGGVGYRVHPRVTIWAEGDLEVLSAVDVAADADPIPDLRLWHYGGGAELAVLPRGSGPLSVSVTAGAGATTFDTDQFAEIIVNPVTDEEEADFNEVFFTANGGLKIAYRVSERVDVFAGGKAFLSFADEEKTAVFSALSPDVDPQGFDKVWSVPIQGGVQVTF